LSREKTLKIAGRANRMATGISDLRFEISHLRFQRACRLSIGILVEDRRNGKASQTGCVDGDSQSSINNHQLSMENGVAMKVRIEDTCVGCGLCCDTCPGVFEMGEGIAVVKVDVVPPELEATAQQAADECPVEAIVIEV
jgi:ferredoxin